MLDSGSFFTYQNAIHTVYHFLSKFRCTEQPYITVQLKLLDPLLGLLSMHKLLNHIKNNLNQARCLFVTLVR